MIKFYMFVFGLLLINQTDNSNTCCFRIKKNNQTKPCDCGVIYDYQKNEKKLLS
jgi:hypothetical protein